MAVSAFFSFVIILNTILPLDLIVGLEFIYLNIRYFIEKDHMMSCTDMGTVQNCKVQTLNLVEELAEVDYMFCDKTGTLTQNILEFRALSVATRPEIFSFDDLNGLKGKELRNNSML